MKIIGITGGVGAGKTQILEYLNNKYGATICMTDEVGMKSWMKKVNWIVRSFLTLYLPTELNFLC